MLLIKIGGGEAINWNHIIKDLTSLVKKEAVVLVHGASTKRDEIAKKLGQETQYLMAPSGHQGVYTDKQALDVLTMVYAGLVNKRLVARLQQAGVNAVGLSGADGQIWTAIRKKYLLAVEDGKEKLIKDTYTGKVNKINAELINLLADNNYVPVITQPAISDQGELLNTDNDRNLAVMAEGLMVDELVVLFEAPGLLKDPKDESSLINQIDKDKLSRYAKYAQGRMRKKLMGAEEAVKVGVKKIYWGDGRVKQPIKSAMTGRGTVIC